MVYLYNNNAYGIDTTLNRWNGWIERNIRISMEYSNMLWLSHIFRVSTALLLQRLWCW